MYSEKKMHIILADSQIKVRSALRLLLEQQVEKHIVDEAATMEEVMNYIRNYPVDVLLLDWKLLWPAPDEFIQAIRIHCSALYIIVVDSNPQTEKMALNVGADRFVSKNDPPERLLVAIRGSLNDGTMNR